METMDQIGSAKATYGALRESSGKEFCGAEAVWKAAQRYLQEMEGVRDR
jgi:hypothetical protein